MTVNGSIPLVDLVTPHRELQEELLTVFRTALETACFIGGPMVTGFENDFAAFCGTGHCVGVSSGTDALRFALMAAGVQPGSTVITVPNTFIATTEAITQAGAHADFVDIDEQTYTMSPAELERYLETQCQFDPKINKWVHRKTKRVISAVVPVHLYGQVADMDRIVELAERYHLLVIEDACQAHGADYHSRRENRWQRAGSIGRAAAFSFYPGKNLGACGEGGAVTTNDAELAQKVRMLRDHGQPKKYYHDLEGYNGRLDAIQAGILRTKLSYLPEWNEKRREIARQYNSLLVPARGAMILPYEPPWARSVYHLYVVRVRERDEVCNQLHASGIGTGIHYPIPLHLQNAYRAFGYRGGDFPVTERVARELLSLPMYPQLSLEMQQYVAERLLESLATRAKVNAGM
jgi:dTDP-4-amino-4,6-dideoxygalactose transaminase